MAAVGPTGVTYRYVELVQEEEYFSRIWLATQFLAKLPSNAADQLSAEAGTIGSYWKTFPDSYTTISLGEIRPNLRDGH
jgi:hypothetical protein